jgi:hypothetical protein
MSRMGDIPDMIKNMVDDMPGGREEPSSCARYDKYCKENTGGDAKMLASLEKAKKNQRF